MTRVMHMSPLGPRQSGGLKGFGFTITFEPQAELTPPPEQSQGETSTPTTSFAGTEGDEGQQPIQPETANEAPMEVYGDSVAVATAPPSKSVDILPGGEVAAHLDGDKQPPAASHSRSGGALDARLPPKQEIAGSTPAQITNPACLTSRQEDEGSSNPRLTRAAPLYPQGDDTGRIAFAAADHGSSMGIHANTGGENVAAPNKRGDEMKAPARIVEVENVLITATRADAGFGSAVEPGTLYTSPEAPFHSITDWEDEDQ